MRFKDRIDAGNQLAEKLVINDPKKTVVLALPRGGVPLAIQISQKHNIPFDVVLAKKLVHPFQQEFAIGALAENGDPILNDEIRVSDEWILKETKRVQNELARRRKLYDQVLVQKLLHEKEVILVDDGIATGMTMFAAIEAVKKQSPNTVTIAVPVIPKNTFKQLETLVDEVVYVDVPEQFLGAVGAYYQYFPQISDDEVQKMLKEHDMEQLY